MGQFLLYFLAGLILATVLGRVVKTGMADALFEAAHPKAKLARLAAEKKRRIRGWKFGGLMVALVVIVLGVAFLWWWVSER